MLWYYGVFRFWDSGVSVLDVLVPFLWRREGGRFQIFLIWGALGFCFYHGWDIRG